MKKKGLDIAFIILFLAIITVPLLTLNTTPELQSVQENRAMTKWPGWGFHAEINEWYGHYFEDRVGVREEAVSAYTKLVHHVFGEFSEDMHMQGKEGYIFPADAAYVQAYQKLKTDEKLLQDFVTYLDNTNQYLKGKGIPFVFMAGLDKKTVYPEYMPDYIHVKEENTGIMERLTELCQERQIPHVIPLSEYQEAKKTQQIYNVKYDSAHWNDLGKMIAVRLADEQLSAQGLEVPVIDEGDYKLTYEQRSQLEFVEIPIDEQVPVYRLEKTPYLTDDFMFTSQTYLVPGTSFQYFYNKKSLTDKTVLIFHDSFLQDSEEFYCRRYRRVYFISRQNYESLQYYVNLINPDAVIFENAERAFVDDLYAYTNLANVKYEPAYTSYQDLSKEKKEFAIEITHMQNASYDGENIIVDTSGEFYVISGKVKLPADLAGKGDKLRLYIKYKNKYYEINYASFREEQPGVQSMGKEPDAVSFYGAFKMRKNVKGKFKFVLVDEETNKEYHVKTLPVKAAEE